MITRIIDLTYRIVYVLHIETTAWHCMYYILFIYYISQSTLSASIGAPAHLLAVALHRVVFRDLCADAPQTAHGGLEVGRKTSLASRRDEGLGWHAARVQAVAAHVVRLNEGHSTPQLPCDDATDEARHAGTQDHQVVSAGGCLEVLEP